MSWFFLILQSGLVGILAHQIYPGWEWEFWAAGLANAVLIVAYGTARKLED